MFEKHFGKKLNEKSNNKKDNEWQRFEEACIYLVKQTNYDVKYIKSLFIIEFIKLLELINKNERKQIQAQN